MRLNAEHHPAVVTGSFKSLEEYCLYLLHKKAYETAAGLAQDLKVLDLGCNNGWGTSILATSAREIIGIDISKDALASARRDFPELDFRFYDGTRLPFEDDQFDLVCSFQVIEHVADLHQYLSEIERVLGPSGAAIFTTPNAAIRLDPGMQPWNEFHAREFLGRELNATLAPYFESVAVKGLFATEVLYRTELDRCHAARLRARGKAASAGGGTRFSMRDFAAGAIKTVLPQSAVDALRSRVQAPQSIPPDLDGSVLDSYSTADFFYRSENLDTALDLMAHCKIPRTSR